MPVYKRAGSWVVDTYVNGQRIRRSLGATASKRDAIEYEAKLQSEGLGLKQRYTFEDALLRWLDLDAKGQKSYESTLSKARLVREHMTGVPLDQAHLAAEKMKRKLTNDGLAPATINRRLALIRRVLNVAYKRWDWLDKPLGSKVELLPENNARHVYLTPEQLDHLVATCRSREVGEVIRLAAYTGLRKSEIYKLRAENIVDGCIILDAETKSGRPRIIPLPPGYTPPTVPVAVRPDALRYGFDEARTAAGMPWLHFHDLRHTYASWMMQGAKSPTVVRDLLGHSSLTVTSRYAHLAAGHLSHAVAEAFSHIMVTRDVTEGSDDDLSR